MAFKEIIQSGVGLEKSVYPAELTGILISIRLRAFPAIYFHFVCLQIAYLATWKWNKTIKREDNKLKMEKTKTLLAENELITLVGVDYLVET